MRSTRGASDKLKLKMKKEREREREKGKSFALSGLNALSALAGVAIHVSGHSKLEDMHPYEMSADVCVDR